MYKKGMLHKESFQNKVILITGGGSGLGKSIGKYLLELGASIIITSRKMEVLQKTTDEFNKDFPDKTFPIAGDVRKIEDVENVINKSIEKFGTIHCLLNNAAGNFVSPTERLSSKGFDVIIDIVLKGTCNFTLTLGKIWITNKQSGTILNITTTYSNTGSGYVVPSAAAKGGVTALTKSIGSEWAKYNIRCNAIAPGPFPTKGAWDRLVPKIPGITKIFDIKKRVPLKRVGEHQELANLSAYLLSDYSAYMTSEVITLDGGEVAYNSGQFNYLDKIPKAMWMLIEKSIRKKNKK